jgi:hypothetical protein
MNPTVLLGQKKRWMAHDGISYCSTLLLPHFIMKTNSHLVQKVTTDHKTCLRKPWEAKLIAARVTLNWGPTIWLLPREDAKKLYSSYKLI